MSGPNLNLDFDPLEGPSTRIWKPKPKEFGGKGLEDVADYVNKFMDNVFAMKTKKDTAQDCRTIPEVGSESRTDASSDEEDVNENSPASKFRSMRIDRERLETLRSLARELGSRMPLEQRWACGSLINMAVSKGLFSGKPCEGKMEMLEDMVGELTETMPPEQRTAFGLLCNAAMKRFREQAKPQDEQPVPVEIGNIDFALD